MEQFNLTSPVQSYAVQGLYLNWTNRVLRIDLIGDDGGVFSHVIEGTEAADLMNTLNKVNLSTKSLHKRILEKLRTDGIIAGTITGTPD